METGGLSKRLVRVADSLIGSVTGSLGLVAILGCLFFGAVSGNGSATLAAIGTIMLPQMVRSGYDKYYATALVIAAGSLGVLIPPSYPAVIYGVTMNTSISDQFIAGIIPGVMVALVFAGINYFYCKKRGLKGDKKFKLKEVFLALKDGFPALLMPVIILGGIYSGAFTTTEAAVVACVYGIVVGKFIYKELSFKQLWKIYRKQAIFVGGTMLTLAPAAALGKIFAYLGVNQAVNNFVLGISSSKFFVMGIIYLILLAAGMFMTTTPCIVIFGPTLYSLASAVGVDPIQFGVVMILSLCVAYITPPVANNLYLGSSMTGLPINKIIKPIWIMLGGLFIVEILVGFVPALSIGLLQLFKG